MKGSFFSKYSVMRDAIVGHEPCKVLCAVTFPRGHLIHTESKKVFVMLTVCGGVKEYVAMSLRGRG